MDPMRLNDSQPQFYSSGIYGHCYVAKSRSNGRNRRKLERPKCERTAKSFLNRYKCKDSNMVGLPKNYWGKSILDSCGWHMLRQALSLCQWAHNQYDDKKWFLTPSLSATILPVYFGLGESIVPVETALAPCPNLRVVNLIIWAIGGTMESLWFFT
ncbi:hypothetical protein SDJN03_25556, partial [Cucurbita argyrosperma subsp. sororia]